MLKLWAAAHFGADARTDKQSRTTTYNAANDNSTAPGRPRSPLINSDDDYILKRSLMRYTKKYKTFANAELFLQIDDPQLVVQYVIATSVCRLSQCDWGVSYCV